MKQTILLSILLFSFSFCKAQNWECIKPYEKQYFINDAHYLRGIRIDSVRVSGTDSVYYPFLMTRINWFTNKSTQKEGCWIGRKIVSRQDGTHLFYNYQNDTLVLKAHATLNDSWTLMSDTLGVYFRALITKIDTMTILGNIDSIKVVLIEAKNSSGTLVNNPINGKEIILSKAHGLVQTIELYTFPYRKPGDTTYGSTEDRHFMEANDNGKILYFKLTSYGEPISKEIYDYNVNDFLQYRGYSIWPISFYINVVDEIKGVIVSSGMVQYNINRTTYKITHGRTNIKEKFQSTYLLTVDANSILGNLMPEEANYFIFYIPQDTNFGKVSDLYELRDVGWIGLSQPYKYTKYKKGIGRINYHSRHGGGPVYEDDTILSAYFIGGQLFGPFSWPENISSINSDNRIQLYPNPANEQLSINLGNKANETYTLCLEDMMGKTVKQITGNKETEIIGVSNLATGIYNLKILYKEEVLNYKVVIQR